MVSSGLVALALAAFVQLACSHPVRYEEGCCPGQVIEQKFVTHKPVTETYSYQVPVYSKKCHQQSAGVDKKVIPHAYETAPVCQTQETTVKIPTTDLEEQNQPLCKRTCTTSSYVIQIPITETTCTSSPLCKKTMRSQDNVLTTVSKKTSCAKQHCTQNTVVEKPIFETVCQDYQQSINKVGAKTVLKPEVHKKCVQMQPYRCMKPVYDHAPVHVAAPVHAPVYAPAAASFDVSAGHAFDTYASAGHAFDTYASAGHHAVGSHSDCGSSWTAHAPVYVPAPAPAHAPVFAHAPACGSAPVAPCNCGF